MPGYPRRVLVGTQAVIASHEVRFPVLRGLVLGVPAAWETPPIGGALLAYMGWARDQQVKTQLGGAGFGVYIGGGFMPALRWNWVWLTDDFHNFTRRPVMQFVFGFNY